MVNLHVCIHVDTYMHTTGCMVTQWLALSPRSEDIVCSDTSHLQWYLHVNTDFHRALQFPPKVKNEVYVRLTGDPKFHLEVSGVYLFVSLRSPWDGLVTCPGCILLSPIVRLAPAHHKSAHDKKMNGWTYTHFAHCVVLR